MTRKSSIVTYFFLRTKSCVRVIACASVSACVWVRQPFYLHTSVMSGELFIPILHAAHPVGSVRVCVLSLLAHFNTILTTSEQWAHDTTEIPTDGCRHSIASLIIQCLACRFVKMKLPLTTPQSVFRFVFFDSDSKRLSSKRHTFARIESI